MDEAPFYESFEREPGWRFTARFQLMHDTLKIEGFVKFRSWDKRRSLIKHFFM